MDENKQERYLDEVKREAREKEAAEDKKLSANSLFISIALYAISIWINRKESDGNFIGNALAMCSSIGIEVSVYMLIMAMFPRKEKEKRTAKRSLRWYEIILCFFTPIGALAILALPWLLLFVFSANGGRLPLD